MAGGRPGESLDEMVGIARRGEDAVSIVAGENRDAAASYERSATPQEFRTKSELRALNGFAIDLRKKFSRDREQFFDPISGHSLVEADVFDGCTDQK